MKAIVYAKYGLRGVPELNEVEKPAPKDDEVLMKVYAASILVGDLNWIGNGEVTFFCE